MIYRVLNIQTCLNAVLLICAGLWFSSSFIFAIRYGGPVITAWFAASSCHPILDSLIILSYIKPYRVYIQKKLNGFLIILGLKQNVIVMVPHSTPVIADNSNAFTVINYRNVTKNLINIYNRNL
jgi:hypothetical protein